MDPEKPFKTIEVVDSRTNQTCKVACMSCIRGHRTTSCGIPVCRPKVFWTVKRPGRPSNSCTCRFGASGGCKCVVARTACPHKSKKGEKRSGECRCDEQGRFCCLLEPEHWVALMSLSKPRVQFFPSREALETNQALVPQVQTPQTPFFSAGSPNSPHGALNGGVKDIANSPIQQGHVPHVQPSPTTYDIFPSIHTALTPRFGMMGVGGPQGNSKTTPPDVLGWQGEAPLAPREFHSNQITQFVASSERGSCCQGSVPSTPSATSHAVDIAVSFEQQTPSAYTTTTTTTTETFSDTVSIPPHDSFATPVLDFDRLQMEYFQYQFPSAICQNCGLSGCSCKNCPPVFQNFGTTSWAQCCGRKHAREASARRTPEPMAKAPRLRAEQQTASARATAAPTPTSTAERSIIDSRGPLPSPYEDPYAGLDVSLPPDLASFDLGHPNPLIMPDGPDAVDISDFLLSDLDRSDAQGDDARSGDGDGGGGCCCGG